MLQKLKDGEYIMRNGKLSKLSSELGVDELVGGTTINYGKCEKLLL